VPDPTGKKERLIFRLPGKKKKSRKLKKRAIRPSSDLASGEKGVAFLSLKLDDPGGWVLLQDRIHLAGRGKAGSRGRRLLTA